MRVKKLVLILAALAAVAAMSACGSLLGQSSGEEAGGEQSPDTKMSREAKDEPVAPQAGKEKKAKTGQQEATIAEVPEDNTLRLTIPKMERINNAEVPTGLGTDEAMLREYHAIHLKYTGFPWEKEANVYIAGHRLGYNGTNSYLAFYDIDKLKKGDKIVLTDANGKEYTYKVFRTMVVEPTDLHVLEPIKGKNIVSLQACTLPDYSDRIIVQGELVST